MSKNTKDLVAAFGRFNDLLEKSVKSRVKLRGFADIDEYIHTGNYLLNALLSGSLRGGYPNARTTGWGGDPGCLIKDEKIRIYKIKSKNVKRKIFEEKTKPSF